MSQLTPTLFEQVIQLKQERDRLRWALRSHALESEEQPGGWRSVCQECGGVGAVSGNHSQAMRNPVIHLPGCLLRED